MKPTSKKTIVTMIAVFALSCIWATGANAALTVLNGTVPAGFCQAGYIQAATLDNAADPTSGGTLTINGIKMIVPKNSIIQMPANTLSWADLFDPAVSAAVYDTAIVPTPITINHPAGQLGFALTDLPLGAVTPLFPGPLSIGFNATVLGNIDVNNSLGFGVGAYIVGLILPIDQDLGNAGAGFITFIDYAKGRFEVGGTLGVQGTGTIIEINDPLGRYGLAHSPDPRFSVDPDNPTVTAGTGYPLGLPKVAPAGGGLFPTPGELGDPDRPYYNRPLNPVPNNPNHDPFLQTGAPLQLVSMPAKRAPNRPGVKTPDPWKQAPLMIGDYITWGGSLWKIDPTTPFNPAVPLNKQYYISANTVGADKLGIYTAQGNVATSGPCYMALERMVIGNGGAPVPVLGNRALGIVGGVIPLAEQRRNIVINGFVTDSTQLVDIFALDIVNGVEQRRLLGTVLPEPGPPGKGNKGRFRFEIGKGNFLPATRTYMASSRHGEIQLPDQAGLNGAPLTGLLAGQYHAPMFTFQFPDAPPGFPTIPNNFDTLPFLNQGEGGNPSAGPLAPFPPVLP
jgi:hypothetical protein